MTYEDLVNKYNKLVEKYNSLVNRYNGQAKFLERKCKENLKLIKEIKKLKELINKYRASTNIKVRKYLISENIFYLWGQTVFEIRNEIKAQETPALVYAKELCDKLEHSMHAVLAGGTYNLKYSIKRLKEE